MHGSFSFMKRKNSRTHKTVQRSRLIISSDIDKRSKNNFEAYGFRKHQFGARAFPSQTLDRNEFPCTWIYVELCAVKQHGVVKTNGTRTEVRVRDPVFEENVRWKNGNEKNGCERYRTGKSSVRPSRRCTYGF